MRKTRLKSEIFVESFISDFGDNDEYDATKEDSQNQKSCKTSPKIKDGVIESKPGLRRSTRLKSQVFDESFLSETREFESRIHNEPKASLATTHTTNSADSSLTGKIPKNNVIKRTSKRKLSSIDTNAAETICKKLRMNNESSKSMTIKTNGIADIMSLTDVGGKKAKINIAQSENLALEDDTLVSSVKTGYDLKLNGKESNTKETKQIPLTRRSSLKISTNDKTKNNSSAKENVDIELNKKKSNGTKVKNVKETNSRKTRRSKEAANNETNKKTSPAKEYNNRGTNINEILNCSTTKSNNNNSILKYFKVQNKNSDKVANCTKSAKKQTNAVQNSTHNSVSDDLHLNKSHIESNEQNTVQVPAKQARERPKKKRKRLAENYTKISKLTKTQIRNVGTRKIPKDRLDDVLNMIDDDSHPIWGDRNISCNCCILFHWNPRNVMCSDHNIKLKYAREFLLRRDWINLSRVLGFFNTKAKCYYPILAKYASLLLAHTNKEDFNKYIQHLTRFKNSSVVMKKCTNIIKENEQQI